MSFRSRLNNVLKPEYVFQPRVFLRRLRGRVAGSGRQRFVIPGGATILAEASEEHGRMLGTLGVVDLPVTEALWRLTAPNEVTADVGANIGYMTGILAARARNGEVHSFEAVPTIYEDLEKNIARFKQTFPTVRFQPRALAVSDRSGTVRMESPADSQTNRGLARVDARGSLEVPAETLDGVFGTEIEIGVMKLDVEGHELAVLRGAEKLLKEHRVRDCVFEEHRGYPTDVTFFLEKHGYTIFRLLRPLSGPRLLPASRKTPNVDWLPQSFLATCEEGRALRAFASRGWQSLRRG